MFVKKRSGQLEPVDFNKINKVIAWSCDGLDGVYPTQILMKTRLSLVDGITTQNIHETLIRAAYDLVTSNPDYTYVASRLAFYMLYKELFGGYEKPKLKDQYLKFVETIYTETLQTTYTDEEWEFLNSKIVHERDYKIQYAGFKQWKTKYLAQNRKTAECYETPQFALMLLSMKMFEISEIDRLQKVVDYYDAISQFKINLPTPILAGVRTKNNQYSSCVLIDTDDSVRSIFAATSAIGLYIANRAGIGANMGRIRSKDSLIRGGEAVHTGKIPFFKLFESATKSMSQGGIRNGSATVSNPFWDVEIMDILVLKNNKGLDDERVRKIDYCIQCSKLLYERYIKNENLTLFSTNEVPGLYEAFGDNEKFDELYKYYETLSTIKNKKIISAREFITALAQQRIETGRIYISNVDNVNSHSSFLDFVRMTNLCVEIALPTTPFESLEDESGEIAMCILTAITAGFVTLEELPRICRLVVESLDNAIETQIYLLPQAAKMKKRRSLGIGMNNLAHYFAQNHCAYGSQKSKELLDEFVQHMTFNCIRASIDLAKERGACEYYSKTKYSKGLLPIHTRNTKIDAVFEHIDKVDWDSLLPDLEKYGMRNSALFAQMPCESSSIVSGTTNADQAPRELMTAKSNKTSGVMRTFVPDYKKLKQYYTLAFDISNEDMNIMANITQKYFDQAMSVNHYYKKAKGESEISIKKVINDILTFYKYGGKNLYYANTFDEKSDKFEIEEIEDICEGGACSI